MAGSAHLLAITSSPTLFLSSFSNYLANSIAEEARWCPNFKIFSADLCGPLRLCGEFIRQMRFTAETQRTAEIRRGETRAPPEATCLWRRARRLKRRSPTTISSNLVATYCLQFMARVGQTFNIELPVRAFVQITRPCRQRRDNYSQPQKQR